MKERKLSTTQVHDMLWKLWDALPPGEARDRSVFNGYRGLFQQYDADFAKAHLNTMHAQGKVSDALYEAIMEAHGAGGLHEAEG